MSIYDQIAQLGPQDTAAAIGQLGQTLQRNALYREQMEGIAREKEKRNALMRLTNRYGVATEESRPAILREMFAQSPEYAAGLQKLAAAGIDADDEYGLAPMFVRDEQGNVIPYQLSKKGGAKAITLPGGARAVRPLSFGDLGGELVGRNPFTGTTEVSTPKTLPPEKAPGYLAEAEGAKETGKTSAAAAMNLPQTLAAAQESMTLLDKALTHPGRATATGLSGTIDPRSYVPGTHAKDFGVLLDQIKGRAFLQAFESLKGGGQITEVEGRKATEAIGRLNTAQSDKEFVTALVELKGVLQTGMSRAKTKAGGVQSLPGYRAKQPQEPDIDALLKKYGN